MEAEPKLDGGEDSPSKIAEVKKTASRSATRVKSKLKALASDTSIYQKYKGLFYTLRIIHECVPAILVALAMSSYVTGLWIERRGNSYHWHTMMPMRSPLVDKSAWHFALTKGETNPECTPLEFDRVNSFLDKSGTDLDRLPLPWEDAAYDLMNDDEYNRCFWWQHVYAVDVYPKANMTSAAQWPKHKWIAGVTPKSEWADSSPDDMWCIAYKVTSDLHVPYGPQGTFNGTCGAVPAPVQAWCDDGWKTSYVLAENDRFPMDDPGWECMLPQDWPASVDGHCYSMCLDISGEKEHTPPQQCFDILLLFLLPILFDVLLILSWIHQKALYDAWHGDMPKSRRNTYFLVAGSLCAAGLVCLIFTPVLMEYVAAPPYPGAITTGLFCIAMGAIILALAMEDTFPSLQKGCFGKMIRNLFSCIGLKDPENVKNPDIDSDEALCFFLVDGFHSKFNEYKPVLTFVVFLIILMVITYFEAITLWAVEYGHFNRAWGFDPVNYMLSRIPVAFLLITKVMADLKPPAVQVGYEVYSSKIKGNRTFLEELKNLTSPAKAVTEREALKYLRVQAIGSSPDKKAGMDETTQAAAAVATTVGVGASIDAVLNA